MVTAILCFSSTLVLCFSAQAFIWLNREPSGFAYEGDAFSRRARRLSRNYKRLATGLVMALSLIWTVQNFIQLFFYEGL